MASQMAVDLVSTVSRRLPQAAGDMRQQEKGLRMQRRKRGGARARGCVVSLEERVQTCIYKARPEIERVHEKEGGSE